MPANVKVFNDPETLTIAKLKVELGKHKIPLPGKDARKAVYVQLYRDEVIGNRFEPEPAQYEVVEHEALFSLEVDEQVEPVEEEEFHHSPVKQTVTAAADSSTTDAGEFLPRTRNSKRRPSMYIGVEEKKVEKTSDSEKDPKNTAAKLRTRRRSARIMKVEQEQDSKPTENIYDDQNIANLSNSELKEKLNDYGILAGPIVSSTRNLYEKKLTKAMLNASKGDAQISEQASFEFVELDDDFNDMVDVSTNNSGIFIGSQSHTPRKRVTFNTTSETKTISSTTTKETNSDTKQYHRPRISSILWILLVIAVLAALLYAVFKSMDSLPQNPLKFVS